jgi:hypothetical protein
MMLAWLLVAGGAALMALAFAALQAIGAERRGLGWALLALAGMLALLPRITGRVAEGDFAPVLLGAATPLILATLFCLWRLRGRAPLPAWLGIAALLHAWIALAAFAFRAAAAAPVTIDG